MKKALINQEKCQNCSTCSIQENCPKTAIIRESSIRQPWVDFYKCSGCMECMHFCSHKAVLEISHPCDGKPRIGW